MVAKGIGFPDATEAMKRLYIQAAKDLSAGEKLTDSRLSIMTGLQRRDVARLRDEPTETSVATNPQARLVTLWQTDQAYKNKKELPRKGPAPSFEALARQVRKDVHPRTVFELLLMADTVSYDAEKDTVKLEQSSYQPMAGSDEQLEYLAYNIGDHAEAAVQNVLSDKPVFFERALHYDGLTKGDASILELKFRARIMELLITLRDEAEEMRQENEGTHRFRAGGYVYYVDQEDE